MASQNVIYQVYIASCIIYRRLPQQYMNNEVVHYLLRQEVHTNFIFVRLCPKLNLSQNLRVKNGVSLTGNVMNCCFLWLNSSQVPPRTCQVVLTWFVKEFDITKLGWPIAQPKLTSLPSANRMMCLPFFSVYRST